MNVNRIRAGKPCSLGDTQLIMEDGYAHTRLPVFPVLAPNSSLIPTAEREVYFEQGSGFRADTS